MPVACGVRPQMRALSLWLPLLVVLVSLAALAEEPPPREGGGPQGDPCTDDSDCPGEGVCAGTCDDEGACLYPTGDCGEPTCQDGWVAAAPRCDGDGTCVPGAEGWCDGYACDGAACGTDCVRDLECLPGWSCQTISGTCQAPDGEECEHHGGCQSNICAGGRCCREACAFSHPVCGGWCDEEGTCHFPSAGTPCTCDDGAVGSCDTGACGCDASDAPPADAGASVDGLIPARPGACGCRAVVPWSAAGVVLPLLAILLACGCRRRSGDPALKS